MNKINNEDFYQKQISLTEWLRSSGFKKTEEFNAEDNEKREIIISCNNSKKLTFYETKAMILYDVLIDEDFYNDNILGKFYRKDLINE